MTAHIAPILFIAKPTKNLIKIQWIFSDLDRLMRVVLTLHRILYMHIYNSNTIYLYRVASCHTLSDCSMPLFPFPFPFSVLRATTHWPSVCFGFGFSRRGRVPFKFSLPPAVWEYEKRTQRKIENMEISAVFRPGNAYQNKHVSK